MPKAKKSAKKTSKKTAKVRPARLKSAWFITKKSALVIKTNWRPVLYMTLLYGFLNLLLVRGFSGNTDVSQLKAQLSSVYGGNFGSLGSGLTVFVTLVGSSGNSTSPTGGAYQMFLGIIASLAIIWMFRQLYLGAKTVRVKDAFYQGMYPIVPFILIMVLIGLQLLPLVIGSGLYSLVVSNGIAVNLFERSIWFVIFLLGASLSLYWISSSLIALYIVTLKDLTPMTALRSAKEVVRGRRLSVVRKILWLPLALFIIAAVVMLPIILWVSSLAAWTFFLLSMFGLVAGHAYMYTLYRELLGE